MRISDWSSDVCSSDLLVDARGDRLVIEEVDQQAVHAVLDNLGDRLGGGRHHQALGRHRLQHRSREHEGIGEIDLDAGDLDHRADEHTSEPQSLMRISYDVFCLKKTNTTYKHNQ